MTVEMPPAAPAEPVSSLVDRTQYNETSGTDSDKPSSEKEANSRQVIGDPLRLTRYRLQFSLDKETGDVVVRVFDPETQEVIRQVPPDEMLELRERLRETRGALIDNEV